MMNRFSHPLHTLHAYWSLHAALCTNNLLYANFPYLSYWDMKPPSLLRQLHNISVLCSSVSWYTFLLHLLHWGGFPWQILLFLLARIAEMLVVWPWDIQSSETFESHFLTHNSSFCTRAWDPSRHQRCQMARDYVFVSKNRLSAWRLPSGKSLDL